MPIENQGKNRFLPFLRNNNSRGSMKITGGLLILAALFILGFIYFPIIQAEIRYSYLPKNNDRGAETKKVAEQIINDNVISDIMVPVDEQFGIVIPKIEANAKVIADVDSQNPAVYQRVLTQGVAHAKGSSYPDQIGNVFIFAHSSADFFEATRYNAVFYLLSKLEKGDKIYIFYHGQKYSYAVTESKKVKPDAVSYLDNPENGKELTLMTCWPPGTTFERIIVIAKPI